MMILSQYHIFELDTINIYSAGMNSPRDRFRGAMGYEEKIGLILITARFESARGPNADKKCRR